MRVSLVGVPGELRDILRKVAEIAKGGKIYLVGGAVRDILLKREVADFDLVVDVEPMDLGSRIVRLFSKASFFKLGKEKEVIRVVVKEGRRLTIDISRLSEGGIELDLLARDFTINAMAVPLSALRGSVEVDLIDPQGGCFDLKRKLIRAVGEDIFVNDPVRLLRAFRLAEELQFKIEKTTLFLISRDKENIKKASPERVSFELMAILKGERACSILGMTEAKGLLFQILSPFLSAEAMRVELSPLGRLEEVISSLAEVFPRFFQRLREELSQELVYARPKLLLLKFFSLLFTSHQGELLPPTKERIKRLGEGFRLSREERRFLLDVLRGYRSLLFLSPKFSGSKRELFRLLRRVGSEFPSALLLFVALKGEPVFTLVERLLLGYYGFYLPAIGSQLLVNGDELIKWFHLPQGRVIGKLLEAVREAQVLKMVRNKGEAIEYVRKLLGDHLEKKI